ncbi:MAG: hypothetical protein HYU69_08600 [Bacteroidetes bacterium]|nr:hypothetical protein [Bacteroidota bacterium]
MATLLVATSLALLVIYAGIKLLIQTKQENLGNLYKGASWFFIIAGLLTLVCIGACCIAMCCKYGMHMMHKGHHMKGYHDGYKKEMKYHHGKMDEGCIINFNCCGSEMAKCCSYMDYCKQDTIKYNRK